MNSTSKILKKFGEDRRDLVVGAKKDARKMGGYHWHFVGRGIEMIAIDETGERNDGLGGPDFLAVNELSVKMLKGTAKQWAKYSPGPNNPHKLARIDLCFGLDVYDDFSDYMLAQREGCGDYTIWEDWAEAEIPIELLV